MVCLDGSVYNLSATPDDGGWSGPGTMAGFAGWFFDPAVAGLGTHTLTYTSANGTESTCTVTVAETLAPFLSLPLGWCQGDGPLALDSLAYPPGGTWTGDGVFNTAGGAVFDASVLTPGTVALTYTVDGPCGGVATAGERLPLARASHPHAPQWPALCRQCGGGRFTGVAHRLREHWRPRVFPYTDSVFYFPSWGDTYTVHVNNEYGCTAQSNSVFVDNTIGLDNIAGTEPLRLWLDAEGRLQASAELVSVRWFDALGRALDGPTGPGPWLVHARAADGRSARLLLR